MVVACVTKLKQIKSQGIGYNAEAGKAHCRSSEHGVQRKSERDKYAGGYRNTYRVVEERPKQVFVYISKRRSAEPYGCGYIGKATLHQNDIGCIYGNICACTYG